MDRTDDARWSRREVVREAMRRANATTGLFYDLAIDPDSGVLRFGTIVSVDLANDVKFHHLAAKFVGIPYEDALDDPATPVDSFQPLGHFGHTTPDELPRAFVEAFCRPAGIHDLLSMNVVDDGSFAGNLTLYRRGDEPPFTPEDCANLRAHEARLAASVVARSRVDHVGPQDMTGLLFGVDGRVCVTSGVVPTEALRESLEAVVARFRGSNAMSASSMAGRCRVRMMKMLDANDCPTGEVLVIARAMKAWRVPEIVHLTVTQRRVAAFAGSGATVNEIAAAMGRSRDTIRAHLRATYEVLGIGTRAELARLVVLSSSQGESPTRVQR